MPSAADAADAGLLNQSTRHHEMVTKDHVCETPTGQRLVPD